MHQACTNHTAEDCIVVFIGYDCPMCALEKRVEYLEHADNDRIVELHADKELLKQQALHVKTTLEQRIKDLEHQLTQHGTPSPQPNSSIGT